MGRLCLIARLPVSRNEFFGVAAPLQSAHLALARREAHEGGEDPHVQTDASGRRKLEGGATRDNRDYSSTCILQHYAHAVAHYAYTMLALRSRATTELHVERGRVWGR